MTAKKLLFFLFFCICLSEIVATYKEEEMRKWYSNVKNAHYEECKHTISEESLQELDDDLEADNEEIRAWRNCLLVYLNFVHDSKINVHKVLDGLRTNMPTLSFFEIESGESYMNICKEEAEQSDNDIDVAGRFCNCVMDRLKSGS